MAVTVPDLRQRVLRRNHRTQLPSRVLYLDTETDMFDCGEIEKHRMKIGWTCFEKIHADASPYSEQWTFFDDTEDLNAHIVGKCESRVPLYVFGHNVYYDLQVSDFFYYFTKWGWSLDFVYDKGLTFILCISKYPYRIKCVSSTNYYQFGLKVLGEMVGLEKMDVSFDDVDDDELSVYCRRDVEILKLAMEKYFRFVHENDLGKFSLTKSSQAYNAYRHRFMNVPIARHENDDIVNLERLAYMGGRTECFRFGKQKEQQYHTLDINSMYPFIMKTCPMPVKCVDYLVDPPLQIVQSLLERYGVVAEVDIDTDEPVYAVHCNGKIMFPVGEITTGVCTEGMKYAFSHDHIRKVRRCAVYEMDYIFSSFVDTMYGLRMRYKSEGDIVMSTLAKYILNSLYGKFGQKIQLEERRKDDAPIRFNRLDVYDAVSGESFTEYHLFNTVLVRGQTVEGKNSVVSIPAHITEYGRMMLWDLIRTAGRSRVFYCDTDGIKVSDDALDVLKDRMHPSKLGYLKVEDSFTHFEIYGNKHYVCDDVRKIKGVPKSARKIDDFQYAYNEFTGLNTHLRNQITRYFIVRHITKDVPPMYDKGTVNPDGSVSPFVFVQGYPEPVVS